MTADEMNGAGSRHDSNRPTRAELETTQEWFQESVKSLRQELRDHRTESSHRFEQLERDTRDRLDRIERDHREAFLRAETAAAARHETLVTQITAMHQKSAHDEGERKAHEKWRSAVIGVVLLIVGAVSSAAATWIERKLP